MSIERAEQPDYIQYLRSLIGPLPVNLVGAAGAVTNQAGELLLQRKVGAERWTIPGGICELGECFEDALRRELQEETSLIVQSAQLLAVVSGAHTFKHIQNGDEFYMYTAVFRVTAWTGTPTPDGHESEELRFFAIDDLPPLAGPVGRRLAELLR
jgi:ADP-ribose pyrophosphatase YjhB (NUDIX family)